MNSFYKSVSLLGLVSLSSVYADSEPSREVERLCPTLTTKEIDAIKKQGSFQKSYGILLKTDMDPKAFDKATSSYFSKKDQTFAAVDVTRKDVSRSAEQVTCFYERPSTLVGLTGKNHSFTIYYNIPKVPAASELSMENNSFDDITLKVSSNGREVEIAKLKPQEEKKTIYRDLQGNTNEQMLTFIVYGQQDKAICKPNGKTGQNYFITVQSGVHEKLSCDVEKNN